MEIDLMISQTKSNGGIKRTELYHTEQEGGPWERDGK